MDFVSIRVITGDINRLVGFYEKVTGVQAVGATRTSPSCAPPTARWRSAAPARSHCSRPVSARPADNHTAIIEFLVDDVDALYED